MQNDLHFGHMVLSLIINNNQVIMKKENENESTLNTMNAFF